MKLQISRNLKANENKGVEVYASIFIESTDNPLDSSPEEVLRDIHQAFDKIIPVFPPGAEYIKQEVVEGVTYERFAWGNLVYIRLLEDGPMLHYGASISADSLKKKILEKARDGEWFQSLKTGLYVLRFDIYVDGNTA